MWCDVSDVVIRAEGLGKKYRIGSRSAERERYTALRDIAARSFKGLGRSALNMIRGRHRVSADKVEEFWALKDISFEVRRGEVVGIIGRNGAGKSTLLKILSRITEPSEGRVEIKGRVASLLEVGTGFHPELTGRENIFLNGAILGMTRAEIRNKFDEIVAFAEVERFLDTPVKRYSSGMYVRLAFAVAAHLEPEILVIDEVLAVGDAEFQKKCLGKMQDVAGHGRTVLFVSHSMGVVRNLCRKGILLVGGGVHAIGDAGSVIEKYLRTSPISSGMRQDRQMPERAHIRSASVEVVDWNGSPALKLRCELRSQVQSRLGLEIAIRDIQGQSVAFASFAALSSVEAIRFDGGKALLELILDAADLGNGQYSMSLMLSIPDIEFIDRVSDFLNFSIDAPPEPTFDRRLEQRWGFGSVILRTLSAKLGTGFELHAASVQGEE